MKRSTNSAPDSLSTSYFTGSPASGISTITLNSCGTLSPAVTLLMLIGPWSSLWRGGCAADAHGNPFSVRSIDRDGVRTAAGGERRSGNCTERTRGGIHVEHRDRARTLAHGIQELPRRIDCHRQ